MVLSVITTMNMIDYKKLYLNFFGYGEQSYIPCEFCGNFAVDVHHIYPKGMGGSKTKDHIENLMGVCRYCHDRAHAHQYTKGYLTIVHLKFMKEHIL